VSPELLSAITVFVLAILVGFEVISKVPATLHTPLMSGANSIHGIVLVGAMFIAATATEPFSLFLALVAVAFGAMNVVGGYVVTDRMLQMFRRREPAGARAKEGGPPAPESAGSPGASGTSGSAGPSESAPKA
jgi:NAD(P) transhydrogenase subunit alpha